MFIVQVIVIYEKDPIYFKSWNRTKKISKLVSNWCKTFWQSSEIVLDGKKLVLEIAPILQLVDKSKFMASIEDFYLGRHLVGFWFV